MKESAHSGTNGGMSMESTQLNRWANEFGKAYTQRNTDLNFAESTLENLEKVFREALSNTRDVKRILEIGCNTGHNSLALARVGSYELVGIDPQVEALRIGKNRGVPAVLLEGSVFMIPFFKGYFDLVLTAGVLMHIGPDELPPALREIDRVTKQYFLSIDYHDNQEINLPDYHGYDDMLWRRDMRKTVKDILPNMTLIWEKLMGIDPPSGKHTYALLFSK
jgi:SAM-dependent methyltransferase